MYAVTDLQNTCTKEQISHLTVQIDKIFELYESISYDMSTTYLFLLSGFECFLLFRRGRAVYLTTLVLFYGYCYFLCTLYHKVTEAEIGEVSRISEIDCYEKPW